LFFDVHCKKIGRKPAVLQALLELSEYQEQQLLGEFYTEKSA